MKTQFNVTTEMKEFTPAQWILIDAAVQYGNDKDLFEDRLRFGRELLEEIKLGSDMTHWIAQADEPALFTKAVIAVEDVLAEKETGHVIGNDAAASGPQLLSIMTHCMTGMINTGALNTGKVPDLYTTTHNEMDSIDSSLTRNMVKKATVPYVYGSDVAPKNVFGDDAPLFEEAYERTVPMAYLIRKILINAHDEDALAYDFDMPNGNHVHLENRGLAEYKGHYGDFTYTYLTSINRPLERGEEGSKSLVANVTHSYDAFVVEELDGRCNYNVRNTTKAIQSIEAHLALGECIEEGDHSDLELLHLERQWQKFNFLSVVGIDLIKDNNLYSVSKEYLTALLAKAYGLLEYAPFETFSIHDEFKCSPKHMNHLRKVYNQIIAESYLSTWLLDTIETLTGVRYEWDAPIDMEIYDTLLNAEFAIG